MTELLTGLQANFNASTDLTDRFAKGLEVSQAADAEALPLCVLTIVSVVPDYSTCRDHFTEVVTARFSLWADRDNGGGDFLLDAGDDIDAAFNGQPMTLATDRLLDARRTGTLGPFKEDERAWRYDLTYTFTVQRNP